MADPPTKIILITAEEYIDRGIQPASIGSLLKAHGYKVTIIKIDQCLDKDARGINPSKYGERYFLADGSIVPINFGYYERFLDQFFTGDHYITNSKMNDILEKKRAYNRHYSNMNDKARSPDLDQEIDEWIKKVLRTPIDDSANALADICIIDFGKCEEEAKQEKFNYFDGLPFEKAILNLKGDGRNNSFMHIHISNVIGDDLLSVVGQINFLNDHHLNIDMIICRNHPDGFEKYQPKIAKISDLPKEMILNLIPEINDDFEIPYLLYDQNVYQLIAKKLNLDMAARHKNVIKIAFVGAFFKNDIYPGKIFEPSDATIIQGLKTAAAALGCRLELVFVYGPDLQNDVSEEVRNAAFAKLEEADGIHFPSGNTWGTFYGFMKACKFAREMKKPFLALAYGFQIAAFEFVQNVCGVNGPLQPISEEENAENEACNYQGREGFKFGDVVIIMLENNGSVKNGSKQVHFLTKDSKIFEFYGNQNSIFERHANTCEMNPAIVPRVINAGLRFVGVSFDESERERYPQDFQRLIDVAQSPADAHDEEGYIQKVNALSTSFMEDKKKFKTAVRFSMFELKDHPFYVGTNFYAKFGHPLPSDPPPLYLGFIEAAKKYKADRIQ